MSELLYLAHRIPFPPNKGDKIRSFNELKYLADRGWAVHLCALADDADDMAYVPELEALCASVAVELISPRRQRFGSVRGPMTGLPLSVPYFYSARLQRRVDDVLRTRPIRSVLCFSGPMGEYVLRSKALPAIGQGPSADGAPAADALSPSIEVRSRLVMDLVDVDSDKWTQYGRFQRRPMSWVYRLEGMLLAGYEARLARTFDAVTLVSPAEAELFGRRCGLPQKVHAVGNGVDLDYFFPTPEPLRFSPSPPPRLVFCGAMDYFPNVDAVVWFAREVLPLLQKVVGEVTFTIVGSKPTAEVQALSELRGVRVTGRVDDVRPFVWEADVSVAPIRVARGVQNKVLEAMAMARPVVATPAAFEGIEAEAGRDLVVADAEPRSLCEAVRGLLSDREAADALGRRGREAVEARYRWGAQLATLESLCRASARPG